MGMTVKRRSILAGIAGSAAAAALAACGSDAAPTATTAAKPAGTTAPATGAATTAPATGAATTAPAAAATTAPAAATTAPATGAATTAPAAAATTAPAAGAATTAPAVAGTGVLKPNATADAYKGKTLAFFQKLQYYKAVQDGILNNIQTYTKSVGASVEPSIQSPDGGPNLAKVQAGVQSGAPFDLIDNIQVGIGQEIALNLYTDVTDLVKQLTDTYGAAMPILPNGLTKDGKYYAVPFFTSSDAWFLRKDWCMEKGIDPSTIDTYEKARDAALTISDPAKNRFGWGFSPYAVGDAFSVITHCINSYGGSIQDKTGTKVVFNSPETVAAITFFTDIYTNAKYKTMLPPGYESWDGSGNNMAWLNGTIGMTSNAFTLYAKAKDDKNPVFDKTFVLQRPKGPATMGGSLRGGQLGTLAIPRGAKNADLAREQIKYLLQPDVWSKIAQAGGGLILPAFESQWKNDFFKSDPNFTNLESQVRDPTGYNQQFYPGPVTAGVDGVSAQKVIENMMASIIQKGQKVEPAVKDAHDQMVKIFEQFGIKQ